jgi:DNA polymerase-3 subunit gamma/tau
VDNFIVSARKYRPATFDTVVGQQHITNTLKNAIKNNQLAQAFLFCGPRGVGKTTCARILAKTINCLNLQPNGEACGECDSCRSFLNGNSFNIHELDAASNNSVDDIRSLIEQVRIPPQGVRYKVYIIDEVHMLSQAAFNAFLKTLEEPPNYAIFILATTEKHKILPTILSRCQIFDFNRIRVEDMSAHLASIAQKESVTYENDGLHIIAQKADGGLRDALSMFDQIVSFSGGNVTYTSVIENLNILDYDYYFNLTDSLLSEASAKTLLLFDEILAKGFDGAHFISGLSEHFRNLLVGKDQSTLKLLEVSEGIKAKYLQQSQAASISFLLSALNIANQCDINYKLSKNQRLQVELALLKMCHLPSVFNASNAPLQQEEVKKKPDTTVNQPIVKSAPVNDVPVMSEAPMAYTADRTPPPTAKPEPVKASPPAATASAPLPKIAIPTRSTLTPSLSNLNSTDTATLEEEDPYEKGTDKEAFSSHDLVNYWNEYAAKAKEEGKATLSTIFAGKPVMLNPVLYEVTVETKFQENALRDEKPALLNFLRSKLKNFDLDIITRFDEIAAKRKPYGSKEIFMHMAAKNPQILELKNKLNLELD